MTINEAIAKLEVCVGHRDPIYEDTVTEVLHRMKQMRGLAFGLLDLDTLVVSETLENAIDNYFGEIQPARIQDPGIPARTGG